MSEYKSDVKHISASADTVYERLSNLENLRSFIDKIPEDKIPADKLEAIKQMELTADSITVPGGPTGAITLNIVERVPGSLIVLKPDAIPMELKLELRIDSVSDDESTLQVVIVADIPMMLRPMVKGPFNQLVTQFADMLGSIPYNSSSTDMQPNE